MPCATDYSTLQAKYVATIVGWLTVSRPFFDTTNVSMNNKDKNELIQVMTNQ